MKAINFVVENIEAFALAAAGALIVCFLYYAIVGTDGNIDEIRAKAASEIPARGWDIMRDEGYQYGNFGQHGGYVWYHVRNTGNHSIQYRVKVSLWGGKLEYWYGAPEKLNRINVTAGG